MKHIEITSIEDVRVGDAVAMGRDGVTVSGTLESSGTSLNPIANWCMYFAGVGTLYGRDGWTLVSATREVPEWEPFTQGRAEIGGTVYRLTRLTGVMSGVGGSLDWVDTDGRMYSDEHIENFVPDDAEALRAEVERLEAEVDRLRAARTVPTREQVRSAVGVAHLGETNGMVERITDAVLALIEQGGAS